MSGVDRRYVSQFGDSPRVASFARHVLGEVSLRPGQTKTARRDAFANWLAEFVVTFTEYEQSKVLDALERARLNVDDLILHCVPHAANLLGQRWTCNELGFAKVSLGSARLFGLCHSSGAEWAPKVPINGGTSVLLATIDIEDHMIGSSVLAYKLRRCGHSVRVTTKATAEELVELLDVGCFDGLLLSCSSIHSLETVADAIKHIKNRACVQVPIVLGGALVHEVDGLKDKTGVTLATNDINTALSLFRRPDDTALPKVAE